MTDSLPAPPEIDPAALAASEFTRARRGLESTEVRAALGRAADALRTWSERDSRLQDRISELELRLDESHELDESRIATVLGEETARIVTAARHAATEIRAKAEEQAGRLIRDSEATATADAERLRGEAQVLRDNAARVAATAGAAATELRETTASEAERTWAEAEAAAATLREEAAALATSTVSDAQSRADELLTAAELVLSERTTEADEAAQEIIAVATRQAEVEVTAATELRETAQLHAAAMRTEAEAEAATMRAEAEQIAAETIEGATVRGRSMVAEARAVRERMLRDLAERRRLARRQLEGALAGRDRIVEVLRAAGEEVNAAIVGLDGADHAASTAADAAAAAVDDDIDAELAALHADFHGDLDDLEGFHEPEVLDPGGDPVPVEGVEREGVEAEVVETDGAETVVVEPATGAPEDVVTGPVAAATSDDRSADAVAPDAAEPTAAEDAADELRAAPEEQDGPSGERNGPEGSPESGATVHDLFARIRAQGVDDVTGPDGAGPDGDVPDHESSESIDLTVPSSGAQAAEPEVGSATAQGAPSGERIGAGDVVVERATAVGVVTATDTDVPQEDPASADRVFDRRDELLLPVEKSLARALKRSASDEQNEMLDQLRRVKRGRPDPEAILPSSDPTSFVESLLPEFARAVDAGAEFWSELVGGAGTVVDADDPEVRGALEFRVGEFLALHRAHLERAFAEADEANLEISELADRVRATYRDWRSGSLSDLAGDLATAGFALGEQCAAGPDSNWCWVVDHGGLPCADGEDNALAGEVACGEPFPTGDVTPPAHPGCRCILAPAHS